MSNPTLKQKKRSTACPFLLMCILSFFLGRTALAQVDQGTIIGTVNDPSGAVIPAAQVTLTDTDTGFVLQGKTNGKGVYVFSPIKIGKYKLSATAPGFETTTQENVRVSIQDRLNIAITLKPGAVQQTVTVTSAPTMLQADSASVGQVVDTETINNTALNGRNWVYIAQLTAGVAPGSATGSSGSLIARGGGTGDFSANGQRTTQNNFILDGVDNNVNVDDFQNGASYNVRPPPDALAEFKIDTSDYSAEFGHSAGAVLNASIKSGTNEIHGDVWEYFRNTSLDAQDWNATTNPPYHENQFGATLGLPIWKNKIFYFGDAEANRIDFGGPQTFTVPTQSMVNGDFSELFNTAINGKSVPIGIFAPNTAGQLPLTCTGGAFSNPGGVTVTAINGQPTTNVLCPGNPLIAGGTATGQLDTVGQEVLAAYPHPNAGGWNASNYSTPGSGQTYNNYTVNLGTKDNTFQWDQRVDWNINEKDQTYARFSYTHDQTTHTPPLGPIIDGGNDASGFSGESDFNLAKNFMISETHLFTPTFINEFRFGYNWGNYQFLQSNSNVPASTLIPGMNGVPFGPGETSEPNGGLPYIVLNGALSISAAGARRDVPSIERQNVYQILDNVTKTVKGHSLRIGLQFEAIRTSFSQSQYPRYRYAYNGSYTGRYSVGNTGAGAADMLTDNMASTALSPGWNTSYYRWYRSAYAQDDWKLNSKLTVNLGVRYDYIQPITNNAGALANLIVTSQSLLPSNNGTGTGIWEMSSKVQSQNLLPASFITQLASQNISVKYVDSDSLVNPQKDNFAPRIGFAYKIDPKTVLRSGYGIFYGAIEAPGGAELTVNFPFSYSSVLSNKFLGGYACNPSPYSGASNTQSQCPSTGVPNTTDAPYLPYPTTIEYGLTNYLNNGGIINYAGAPVINLVDPNVKTPYTQSYNLTVEHELSANMVATLGYVGNVGRHTYTGTGLGSPLALTNPQYSSIDTAPFPSLDLAASGYIGESMYNGLQAKLERRLSRGLSFLSSYTWSHAGDSGSNPGIGGGPGSLRNTHLIPLKDEFTNADFDIRQRFTLNGFYELPFGKGKRFLHDGGALGYLAGGWSTSLTFQAQSGSPFTVSPGGNFEEAGGGGSANAVRVGDPFAGGGTVPAGNVDIGSTCPAHVHNRTNWYNPCAFIDPKSGLDIPYNAQMGTGTLVTDEATAIQYLGGKSNQIYGPGYERVNMSAFKNFPIWHEQFLQFRADAFNLLNHPTWGNPDDTSLNPTGGNINSYQTFQNYTPDARFFQLAAKYVF